MLVQTRNVELRFLHVVAAGKSVFYAALKSPAAHCHFGAWRHYRPKNSKCVLSSSTRNEYITTVFYGLSFSAKSGSIF
jgi:hypothetical protein